MERNYPQMFSTTDDENKDRLKLGVFKFHCCNALKIGCTTDFGSTYRLRNIITINISLN